MRFKNLITIAATAAAFVLPGELLHAQAVGFRYRMTPKTGMSASFEAALKAHVEFRTANGDPWNWAIYQVVAGEELGSFLAVSNGHAYGDMDAYESAPFNATAGAHFAATVMPLLESIGLRFNINDTVVANAPPDGFVTDLLPVTRFYVTPTGGQAFDEALAMFHAAVVATNFPAYYAINRPTMGGRGGTVNLVNLSEDWAGLADRNPNVIQMMVSHYGQERATEIFNMFLGAFTHSEEYLLRARPDLSVTAGGM